MRMPYRLGLAAARVVSSTAAVHLRTVGHVDWTFVDIDIEIAPRQG